MYQINADKSSTTVAINKKIIDNFYRSKKNDHILIAGAGNGQEGINLSQYYDQKIYAVDVAIDHKKFKDSERIIFETQDISQLNYKDNFFSLAYSYHVLEHVKDPVKTLKELHRVLEPGGVLFIGFPNRTRLVGYIGSHNTNSLLDKIKYNLKDYGYRLKGKFHNKFGAHAGFSEKEFVDMAGKIFSKVVPVRDDYMRSKYKHILGSINLLVKLKVLNMVSPSNYFVCIN